MPQRLITVFESLVDTDKLFLNPNICNKHLIQADTEEPIVCSKHYISPRKVSLSTWASAYLSDFKNIVHCGRT